MSERGNSLVSPFISERPLAVLGLKNLGFLGLKQSEGESIDSFIQKELSKEVDGFAGENFTRSDGSNLELFITTSQTEGIAFPGRIRCKILDLRVDLDNGDTFKGKGKMCPSLNKNGVAWKRVLT